MAIFDLIGSGVSAGGPRGKGGFSMQVTGVSTIQKAMKEVEDGLRMNGNREMRAASKDMAEKILIPALAKSAQSSPMELSRRFVPTMRAKSDRVVTVTVGATLPSLSGLRRGIGSAKAGGIRGAYPRERTTRNYATTLAWASEFGPYPGSAVNRYGVPRNKSGYWVQPAIEETIDDIRDRWMKALSSMLAKYSRFR